MTNLVEALFNDSKIESVFFKRSLKQKAVIISAVIGILFIIAYATNSLQLVFKSLFFYKSQTIDTFLPEYHPLTYLGVLRALIPLAIGVWGILALAEFQKENKEIFTLKSIKLLYYTSILLLLSFGLSLILGDLWFVHQIPWIAVYFLTFTGVTVTVSLIAILKNLDLKSFLLFLISGAFIHFWSGILWLLTLISLAKNFLSFITEEHTDKKRKLLRIFILTVSTVVVAYLLLEILASIDPILKELLDTIKRYVPFTTLMEYLYVFSVGFLLTLLPLWFIMRNVPHFVFFVPSKIKKTKPQLKFTLKPNTIFAILFLPTLTLVIFLVSQIASLVFFDLSELFARYNISNIAEYATSGFFQLMVTEGIFFALIIPLYPSIVKGFAKSKKLKILTTILFGGIFLLSWLALYKLWLYISIKGITYKRIVGFFILITNILCIGHMLINGLVKLYRNKEEKISSIIDSPIVRRGLAIDIFTIALFLIIPFGGITTLKMIKQYQAKKVDYISLFQIKAYKTVTTKAISEDENIPTFIRDLSRYLHLEESCTPNAVNLNNPFFASIPLSVVKRSLPKKEECRNINTIKQQVVFELANMSNLVRNALNVPYDELNLFCNHEPYYEQNKLYCTLGIVRYNKPSTTFSITIWQTQGGSFKIDITKDVYFDLPKPPELEGLKQNVEQIVLD